MEEKISIIIPCYNVENYIEKTVDSLLNQTYKNLEIIIIDDCSTDNTLNKIKKFESIKNIKIYKNTENKGQAFSRNFAMGKVTGDYIGFVDSDDYIDEDFYEKLLKSIKKNESDIAVADIASIQENNENIEYLTKACVGSVNKFNVINNGLAASPCNKLFKKKIIEKYKFLEGKMNEDVASIIPAVANCKKISYVQDTKYYYLQRKNSTQNSKISMKRFDMFDAVELCFERIKENKDYQEYKDAVLYHQIFMIYAYILPKEEKFWKRYKFIKTFMKKQKKYNLYTNKYLEKFLKEMSEEEKKYFGKLVKCLKYRQGFKANWIIHFKDFKLKLTNYIKDIIRMITKRTVIKRSIGMKNLIKLAKKQSRKKQGKIKISVIIPNYNYENFLIPRLYSILNQTEKIYEIILLDDCSKDGSRIFINEFVENVKKYINVQKIYNKENSGCAFKQWKKGFKLAKGDYVWIAEADDCCDKSLIKNIIKPINKNNNIYISYADTAFINAWDKIILPTIKPEIDIRKTNHWESDFVDNGIEEIEKYTYLNCIIANVSSCLIKNDNYDDIFEKIIEYKQAGDWLFYVMVMKRGDISFINKPLNYYRLHGNNVTSLTKKQNHFAEIVKIHSEIRKLIKMTDWHEEEIKKRYEFLKRVWGLEEIKNEKN